MPRPPRSRTVYDEESLTLARLVKLVGVDSAMPRRTKAAVVRHLQAASTLLQKVSAARLEASPTE